MSLSLKFLGGAGTVTGSRYLLQGPSDPVLIDCGLFQGLKALRLKNWDEFPISPSQISAVFLTHAHLDHSGYLPKLVAEGFQGEVYCTPATRDLCEILLLDSAKLMEEEASYANKRGYSKHHPARPLYTSNDVHMALKKFRTIDFHQKVDRVGLQFEYSRAGHILGAASLRVVLNDLSLTFSGDVGRSQDEVMMGPEALCAMDYMVVESTYGNRKHPPMDGHKDLIKPILEIVASGGTLLIPAFAVGRAQEILYIISQLKMQKTIPNIPVFLDSPMATSVTEILCKYPGEHRLAQDGCRRFSTEVTYVQTTDESKALDLHAGPRIIVSASGMATGGRVLHHLKALAPDPRNQILFAGYQAAGTRGAAMVDGSKEIKIHGLFVKVAAKVVQLNSLSAHADADELLAWLKNVKPPPKHVFVTHGEAEAADVLRRRIQDEVGVPASVPELGSAVQLPL